MSAFMARPLGHLLAVKPVRGLQVLLQPKNSAVPRILGASIYSKANNIHGYKRPEPFPYKEKEYTLFHYLYDKATSRFNENTKVLVVEGPIAAGKTTFAKALAEELDMLYIPEASVRQLHTNEYGQYLKDLNHLLPVSTQVFDVEDFYRDPKHVNVAKFQVEMLQQRFRLYMEALAHLLNSGQGVVLDRCLFSDFVFLEAMFESNYVSKQVRKLYLEMAQYMKDYVPRPHLIIYLDIPVDLVLKRVKDRGNEWESKSSVMNKKYLSSIENHYKHSYLKPISQHSEVLIYDWTAFGDVEVVVEDIERIDFDNYSPYDDKLQDWRCNDKERDWLEWRIQFTNKRDELLQICQPVYVDAPELLIPSDDNMKYEEVLSKTPGWKYAGGFNKEMGDQNMLFKSKKVIETTI